MPFQYSQWDLNIISKRTEDRTFRVQSLREELVLFLKPWQSAKIMSLLSLCAIFQPRNDPISLRGGWLLNLYASCAQNLWGGWAVMTPSRDELRMETDHREHMKQEGPIFQEASRNALHSMCKHLFAHTVIWMCLCGQIKLQDSLEAHTHVFCCIQNQINTHFLDFFFQINWKLGVKMINCNSTCAVIMKLAFSPLGHITATDSWPIVQEHEMAQICKL